MIDGKTRICGLIGNPVEHTLSPVIHNSLAEIYGHNLAYVPFLVEKNRLEEAVKGAFALNVLGCNVTVPYKTDIIPYLKEIDQYASKIGAVNTLVRNADGYVGYNTDAIGLYRAMQSDHIILQGAHVVIIGAGGVARAAAMMMAEKSVERLLIMNRTLEKAENLVKQVKKIYPSVSVKAIKHTDFSGFQREREFLAVQATNIGMFPNCDETVIEDDSFYWAVHTGYDMIFNPKETVFMRKVSEAGGKAYNGLKMLLFQGIVAYELWNRVSISEKQAEAIYKKLEQSGK